MIYDNGIFVNDQIGISATFSLVALGVSILGMVLQILAYPIVSGGCTYCEAGRTAGIGGCVPYSGSLFPGLWRI